MNPTSPHDPPDAALVARALADPESPASRAAASQLLARHQHRVYVWCHRYVRDHERALDLAQEVLLNAYRGLGSFGGRSQFSSWLFSVTRNRCLNALATKSYRFEDDETLERLPDEAPGPEDEVERFEDEERLRTTLARHLAPDEAEAMWLQVHERLAVEEIGEVLKLENATGARALLQRARRKLRAALSREEFGGG